MADDPAYIKAFKEFARGDLKFEDLPALEAELYGARNDRASAVILGSILETALETLLKATLRPNMNREMRRTLFDFRGPMGDFSSKIAVAFAIGIIGPISHSNLELIRLLRNEFAHARRHFKFATREVAELCRHLQTPDQPGFYIPHGYLTAAAEHELKDAADKTVPRTRYIATCHSLSHKMLALAQTTPSIFVSIQTAGLTLP